MDIVIVLDGSNSIYPWYEVQNFLSNILSKFHISPEQMQVSLCVCVCVCVHMCTCATCTCACVLYSVTPKGPLCRASWVIRLLWRHTQQKDLCEQEHRETQAVWQ